MNPASQILNAIGQAGPSSCPKNGSGAVTVVIELGPETLTRLDRLLATLEAASHGRPEQPGGLPQPLTFDDGQRPNGSSPYLDAQEAAAYLGINVKSLYGLVERRQLVPLRGPRRRYRFTVEMLDEYLRSRR